MSRILLLTFVLAPLVFAGCSNQAANKATPIITPVMATAAPAAPSTATTAAPSDVSPPADTREPFTQEDAAWSDVVLPAVAEASKIVARYYNDPGSNSQEARTRLEACRDVLLQKQTTLRFAPPSTHFKEAHVLLQNGIDLMAEGALSTCLWISMKDTSEGKQNIEAGLKNIKDGAAIVQKGTAKIDQIYATLKH